MNPCEEHRAGRTRYSAETTRPGVSRSQFSLDKPPIPKGRPMPQTHAPAPTPSTNPPKTPRPFKLIGELINNSFARAARAWAGRDVAAYQKLAKLQTDLGADYLTLNIDGTQTMRV